MFAGLVLLIGLWCSTWCFDAEKRDNLKHSLYTNLVAMIQVLAPSESGPTNDHADNHPEELLASSDEIVLEGDNEPASQHGTSVSARALPPMPDAQARRRRAKEFRVPVGKVVNMNTFGGPFLLIEIHADRNDVLMITIGGRRRRVRKEKGFEGDNYTPLLRVAEGTLYYVDTLRSGSRHATFVVD